MLKSMTVPRKPLLLLLSKYKHPLQELDENSIAMKYFNQLRNKLSWCFKQQKSVIENLACSPNLYFTTDTKIYVEYNLPWTRSSGRSWFLIGSGSKYNDAKETENPNGLRRTLQRYLGSIQSIYVPRVNPKHLCTKVQSKESMCQGSIQSIYVPR